MPTAPCPPISARWTWDRDCPSRSGRWWRRNSTLPVESVKDFHRRHRDQRQSGRRSGSTGVQEGGRQMRMAAAEARRVLVEMAANKLGLPADQLTVTDGVVRGTRRCRRSKISYAELIGGQYLQRSSRLERQIRQSALRAGQGATEGPQGSHDRRAARSARRHRAESVCANGLRHRRQSPGHDARPHDPARQSPAPFR